MIRGAFIAAIIALLSNSCVTDTTESTRIEIQDTMPTTEISLSLEGTRTQLGDKADGVYPLYWSKGDKISVNGIESEEAVIDSSNPARAAFHFNDIIEGVRHIAYPAAPEGKVLFAETQLHAGNNSFGSDVSTMYGVGNKVNYLVGALKLGILGSATLTKIVVSTADYTPISGLFDIDFESGVFTPTAESKNSITYSFGEKGVELDATTPTYAHIAIPAGEYSLLRVRLYDSEGGVMQTELRAPSTKPIRAGIVREFSNPILYKAASAADVKVGKMLPLWEEGYLDIHMINSGRGECTFYILPDGTTMVVDVGEIPITMGEFPVAQRPSNDIRPTTTYARYIKSFSPEGKSWIDYCIISHFHNDHFGDPGVSSEVDPLVGYRKIGAMALYAQIPFRNILDRAYPSYTPDDNTPAIDHTNLVTDWKKLIEWGEGNGTITAARFTPGQKQIMLLNNKEKYSSFEIMNVCANGFVFRKSNKGVAAVYDSKNRDSGNPPSCGFHLKYGEFDYMSCGDVTSTPQNHVADYFNDYIGAGHIDAFKGHHHLSANSWGSDMRATNFNPQVVLNHNFYKKQPDYTLLTGYVFPVTESVFTTNAHPDALAEMADLYGAMAGHSGHLVLRVAPGGGSFYVYILDDSNFEYRVKSIHGPYTSK